MGGAASDAVVPRVQHLTHYRLRPAPDAAPRADDEDRFGFPSGHVATTTALFVGVAVLARRRWAWAAAAGAAALMGLSRMYLGRHFPGDVLGGLALGVIGVWHRLVCAPPANVRLARTLLTIRARFASV